MRTNRHVVRTLAFVLALSALLAACGGRPDRAPVVTSPPTPTNTEPVTEVSPEPAPPMPPPVVEDDRGDDIIRRDDPLGIMEVDLDTVNEMQPLVDVRFSFDSATLEPAARTTLDGHASILEQYPTLTILIEGHCDERGTVEYNLALGDRRANSVYNYLMSLGIAANRMKTITYGKEFPLDPGHTEEAWARNRRARFEITAK